MPNEHGVHFRSTAESGMTGWNELDWGRSYKDG